MLHDNRTSWFSFLNRKTPRRQAARRSAYRPSVDALEDRVVPSGNSIISGVTYQDLTGNGYSADDSVLAHVTVNLYKDSNHDGKLDSGDSLYRTTNSALDGSYAFNNLGANKYFVTETTPSGFVRTTPVTGSSYTIDLGANESVAGNDFDNFQKVNTSVITNISFTVYNPTTMVTTTVTNLRGNTQQGDIVTANFTVTGSASVLVTLTAYDAPGASFDANTASQQYVVFQDSETLSPGAHSLTVHLPDNFYQVDFVAGSAISTLGPAGSNIFYSAQSRLLSADNEGTHAFAPATVSGIVYTDVNGTGIYGAGDLGLGGVTVTLTGTNDLGQPVTLVAVTADGTNGPRGTYSFPLLREGTYTITQTTPPMTGFVDETSNEAFTLGGTASPGVIANINVTSGGMGGNYNLPQIPVVTQTASISGKVIEHGNSAFFTPVTVYLTDSAGVPLPGYSTTVAANGTYSFTNLPTNVGYKIYMTYPPANVQGVSTDPIVIADLTGNLTNQNFILSYPHQ